MNSEVKKLYYSYEDIHNLVKELSSKIVASEFKPDYILAVGGGGFIPARILRTFIETPVISLTINYYNEDNTIKKIPNIIQWIDNLSLTGKKLLIVDEIDDTRKTLNYIVSKLIEEGILSIGIAVIHNKQKEKQCVFDNIPYFSAQEIPDQWVVYPWDIV